VKPIEGKENTKGIRAVKSAVYWRRDFNALTFDLSGDFGDVWEAATLSGRWLFGSVWPF